MYYGSPFYLLTVLLVLGVVLSTYLLLKRCEKKTQSIVIVSMMALNVIQHLFKFAIYPQYYGQGFSFLNTAYNMCAFLILLSPIAYFSKSNFLKDFTFHIGAIAGFIAILVPYWFIGLPISQLGWEYARMYICHLLLCLSSSLTLMLGHYKPSYKRFYKVGLGFILALILIIFNDIVAITLGIFPKHSVSDLYKSLEIINPCWAIAPPDKFLWLIDVIKFLSPSVFCGNNKSGMYVPVLWYAVPLYIGITLASFVVYVIRDRENFCFDIKKLCSNIKMTYTKIKYKLTNK